MPVRLDSESVDPCAAMQEELEAQGAEGVRQHPDDVWGDDHHWFDPHFLDAGFDEDFGGEDVFADPAELVGENLEPHDMCARPDEVAAEHVLDGEDDVRHEGWDADARDPEEM